MQEDVKKLICLMTGKTYKMLRGNKSQYVIGAEYGIPSSVISELERGRKDPQLTTIFKLAESCGLRPSEFVAKIEEALPSDLKVCDD